MAESVKKIHEKKENGFVQNEMTNRCKDCNGWFKEDQKICPYCGSNRIFSQPYQKPTVPY